MKRERLWLAFAILAGISFAFQVAKPPDPERHAETTFDTAPRGHGGLYALLARFDLGAGRWLSGLEMPPVDSTVWYVAPQGVCESRGALRSAQAERESGTLESGQENEKKRSEVGPPFRYTVVPWIEAGGTAVVWLSHPPMQAEDEPGEPSREDDAPGFGPEDAEIREAAYRPVAGVAESDGGRGTDATGNADEDSDVAPEARDADSIREEFGSEFDRARKAVLEGEARPCVGIAGFALPGRVWSGLEGGELPVDAQQSATAFSVGRAPADGTEFDHASARILPGGTLAFFERDHAALEGWEMLWVEADDASPFALVRAVGAGRLIVVADARVLTNDRLAKLDSAPFVIDWVEDWGMPWIDEHRHGLVPESGTFRYLAKSPAAYACAGLLVLGLLVFWHGRAWPPREVDEVDPAAPTLSTFVESVAALYAETRDFQTAFDRYRQLTLDRIRRSRGMSHGASEEVVLASLRARLEARVDENERGLLDLLSSDVVIRDQGALERSVVRLDRLVELYDR